MNIINTFMELDNLNNFNSLRESLEYFEIGNHITDHYVFPSAQAKYDCILDIKSRYKPFEMVDQNDLDQTAAKFGGKLTESKKTLIESFDDTMLEIEGFAYHIVDTFEDDGYEGYEVVYAKDGVVLDAQMDLKVLYNYLIAALYN